MVSGSTIAAMIMVVKYKNKPIFSVQHHPEASPGPHESKYIFKEFADSIK